jgi:hypothetical protein
MPDRMPRKCRGHGSPWPVVRWGAVGPRSSLGESAPSTLFVHSHLRSESSTALTSWSSRDDFRAIMHRIFDGVIVGQLFTSADSVCVWSKKLRLHERLCQPLESGSRQWQTSQNQRRD